MATIDITGTITTPSGTPVPGVVVTLTPSPADPGASQAQGGVGIILTPDSVQTDGSGNFTIAAQVGFRYNLTITAIGYSRDFVTPTTDTRFDLLGLIPAIESITDWVTDGCEGVLIGDPPAEVDKLRITIKVDSVTTVRERFNVIEIEKATTQDGVYVGVDEVDLVDGVIFYEYDADDVNTDWYRVRYANSANADRSEYSPPRAADGPTADLVISVDELKELYLFGVDLTDDDGNPFPDRMFTHYIESAIAWMEKELDIPITPIEIVDELHDHLAGDYGRWGWFDLYQFPIICIREVGFQYPSQDSRVIIQNEWIVLPEDGTSGLIQIVPGQGSIADVLLIPGQLMPMWSGATGRVPGVWRFTYRAGFEIDEIPADIKDAIGMKAAIQIFNIAGDLIAGAGIANTSISVPGLSQSIGTTSSATNSGYGARIGQYEKQLKEMLPNLRRYYGKGTRMVVA